jgi:hypothetical protein
MQELLTPSQLHVRSAGQQLASCLRALLNTEELPPGPAAETAAERCRIDRRQRAVRRLLAVLGAGASSSAVHLTDMLCVLAIAVTSCICSLRECAPSQDADAVLRASRDRRT